MSFMVDNNEPEELDYWLSQSYEVKRGAFNKTSGNPVTYPDITVLSKRIIGVNRKQSGEWLGGFSAWQEQILRELNGPVDYMIQVIEGGISPLVKEGLWSWDLNLPRITVSYDRLGNPTGGGVGETLIWKSNQDYKHVIGELIRLADSGIPTFFTGNIFGTAQFLVELHSIVDREDWEPRLLTRLVKQKYEISERELVRRNLILFLMGIPSVGQSVATALVDYFGTFDDLYSYISSGLRISGIELNSVGKNKRTIGPAIERNMRMFFGLGVE